ncbi:major capsid protein [Caudoviricetes sp.]|nr:major capsid protein [Caudoviricetes sp.]
MHLDKENTFTPIGTALTATATSDVVDTQGIGDVAIGCPLYVVSKVHTALTSGGASTLTAVLQTATDLAFTSPITLMTSGSIAKASLVKGYNILQGAIPIGAKRYLRIVYTVGTADFTAGKISSFITTHPQAEQYLNSAVPVN